MKRVCCLCLALILVLTGCKSKDFKPVKELDCIITYTNNGVDYKANLRSYRGDIVEIEMISPDYLSGLTFIHDDFGTKIDFYGFDYKLESSESGIFTMIIRAVKMIIKGDLIYEQTENGKISYFEDCTLTFNEEGYLTEIDYYGIIITFSDYK